MHSSISSSSSPTSTWKNDCQPGLPLKASILSMASSLWPPPSRRTTQHTGVCRVWKSSYHVSSLSREALAILPLEWLEQASVRMLTAEASLGMVSAPGDKGFPQWHLSSMLGGKQQECPLKALRAGVLEWHLELLLDLLMGLDALLWPLHTEPSFPSQQSTSVLS